MKRAACLAVVWACLLAGCANDVANVPAIIKTGMDFKAATDLARRWGADQPDLLKRLPHDIGYPGGRMEWYRLPSGTVIQVYSMPGGSADVVWLVGVFSYRPSHWDWLSDADPELLKMIASGKMLHEFDLGADLHPPAAAH